MQMGAAASQGLSLVMSAATTPQRSHKPTKVGATNTRLEYSRISWVLPSGGNPL